MHKYREVSVRIPIEDDLKSINDETWATAVMQCSHGYGFCGSDGYCHADGACFINPEMTLDQAMQEILHLRKELDEARAKCNQIDSLHLNLVARLEQSKDIALKEGKSERLFALRQCLSVLKRGVNN